MGAIRASSINRDGLRALSSRQSCHPPTDAPDNGPEVPMHYGSRTRAGIPCVHMRVVYRIRPNNEIGNLRNYQCGVRNTQSCLIWAYHGANVRCNARPWGAETHASKDRDKGVEVHPQTPRLPHPTTSILYRERQTLPVFKINMSWGWGIGGLPH